MCGLESCASKHKKHGWSQNEYTNSQSRATGPWGPQKDSASIIADIYFSGVVGVSSGTGISKMSLGGDDRTKHNIFSSMVRSSDSTTSQQGEYPCQCRWPILGSHCLFRVLWYERWGDADIWHWVAAGGSSVSCWTCYLICVSVGRSDSRHEADSPFHAIPKIPRNLCASAVLMMSKKKGVNESHYRDPILETWQEHLGDQVMKRSSMSPNGGEQIVQEGTLVVMRERERVGFIRASNSTRLFLLFSVKSLCSTQPVANDA